jgi:hypothetical protein
VASVVTLVINSLTGPTFGVTSTQRGALVDVFGAAQVDSFLTDMTVTAIANAYGLSVVSEDRFDLPTAPPAPPTDPPGDNNTDTVGDRTDLGEVVHAVEDQLTLPLGDQDWFKIQASVTGSINVRITLDDLNDSGGLDSAEILGLELYEYDAGTDSAGDLLAVGVLNTATSQVRIDGFPATAGEMFLAKVTDESSLPVNAGAATGAGFADIVVIADESGSMAFAHVFMQTFIPALETGLTNLGLGTVAGPNRYGLVGYGGFAAEEPGHTHLVGGGLFGTAAQFVTAAAGLTTTGAIEDGYEAIDFTLRNYGLRPTAEKIYILVTNEDRDITVATLNFANTLTGLTNAGVRLYGIYSADIRDSANNTALAIANDFTVFLEDGLGGFTTSPNGTVTSFDTTVADYVNLSFATNAIAGDIDQIQAGGLTSQSFAQAMLSGILSNITISPGTTLNTSNDTALSQVAPSVDMNPLDDQNIVSAAQSVNNATGSSVIDVFFSTNAGQTSQRRRFESTGGVGNMGLDGLGAGRRVSPAVSFDANGHVYVAYGFDGGVGNRRIVVAHSSNGGDTFPDFTSFAVTDIPDSVRIATGRDANVADQEDVYVSWMELDSLGAPARVQTAGSRGSDAAPVVGALPPNGFLGFGFGAPTLIANQSGVPDVTVDAAGRVLVTWVDYSTAPDAIRMAVDSDGIGLGAFGPSRFVASNHVGFRHLIAAQNERGVSASPSIVVDRTTGPNAGRIYVGYTERGLDDASDPTTYVDLDTFLKFSDDSGVTWSDTRRISTTSDSSQFNLALDIDQTTGHLIAGWYDGREDVTGLQVRPFFAQSVDGGVTFRLEGAVGSGLLNQSGTIPPLEDFGDRLGLATHAGIVQTVWSDNTDDVNELELFTIRTLLVRGENAYQLDVLSSDSAEVDTYDRLFDQGEDAVREVRESANLFASTGGFTAGVGGPLLMLDPDDASTRQQTASTQPLTGAIADIDFSPAGTLIGGTAFVDAANPGSSLVFIDPDGGTIYRRLALSGAGLPATFSVTAVEFSPGGGQLFMAFDFDPTTDGSASQLGRVNLAGCAPTTCVVTLLGQTGVGEIGGMAFSPATGELLGVTSTVNSGGNLVSLDAVTGQATFLATTGFTDVTGLEFSPDGLTLYAVLGAAEPAAPPGAAGDLVVIDPFTGLGSVVGPVGPTSGLTGISFRPQNNNTPASATSLGSALHINPAADYTVTLGDNDWYRVRAVAAGGLSVRVNLTDRNGDGLLNPSERVRVRLYDSTGNTVLATGVVDDLRAAVDGTGFGVDVRHYPNDPTDPLTPSVAVGDYYLVRVDTTFFDANLDGVDNDGDTFIDEGDEFVQGSNEYNLVVDSEDRFDQVVTASQLLASETGVTGGDLFTLNQTTAAATAIAALGSAAVPDSLAFHPSGVLFGERLNTVTSLRELVSINPDTGAVTALDTDFPDSIPGGVVTAMAVDPATQLLYGAVLNPGAPATSTLLRIEPNTGGVTAIPTATSTTSVGEISGLVFDATGVLYGVTQSALTGGATLITLNTITGIATPVGPAGLGIQRITGLAFDPSAGVNGTLYGVVASNDPALPGRLVTFNTTTGAATVVGNTGLAPTAIALRPQQFSNDIRPLASQLGTVLSRTETGLSLPQGDRDFYAFRTSAGGRLEVRLDMADFNGNAVFDAAERLRFEILDSDGTTVLASSTAVGRVDSTLDDDMNGVNFPADAGDDPFSITIDTLSFAADKLLFVRVFEAGESNLYDLTISVASPDSRGPRVTSVTPVHASFVNASPATIVAGFDENLDPTSATATASYRFVRAGGDGIFGNANDVNVISFFGAPLSYTAGATASLTTGLGPNSNLVFTARAAGTPGNTIRIQYRRPAPNRPTETVTVDATTNFPNFIDIIVDLATNAGGLSISNAAAVRQAIQNTPAASALVDVQFPLGNNGTGIVSDFGPTALAGGAASLVTIPINGTLPDDLYRFTINGTSGVRDQLGNALDGEFFDRSVPADGTPDLPSGDNVPGGDFVSTFTVDTVQPTILDVVDVDPDPRDVAVSTVDVVWSEVINLATFDFDDLSLTHDADGGGSATPTPVALNNTVTVARVGTSTTYRISGLTSFTAPDGEYTLCVDATTIQDLAGNAGVNPALADRCDTFTTAVPPRVVDVVDVTPDPRNTAVDTIDVVLSEVVTGFDRMDLTLTRGGVPVTLDNTVAVTQVGMTATYTISGLAAFTGVSGTFDYVLTVDATGFMDLNGNAGLASGSGSDTWRFDNDVPAAPSVDLVAASDTFGMGTAGTSADELTRTTLPTFTGMAEANSTVTLRSDVSGVLGTQVAVGGVWTITSGVALPQGVHNITATATDAAGNESAASTPLVVTIDTQTATPSVPNLIGTSDTGVSNTDNITFDNTPTFDGTAEAGALVTLTSSIAGVLGSAIATGGVWSFTVPTALADGVHNITAQALDLAGNTSAITAALSVTIDTIAPAVPSTPDLAAASDSGVLSTDNITAVQTPTFTGTAPAGVEVRLFEGATLVGSGTATLAGAWSIATSSLAGSAAGIQHSITARTRDVAGNESAASPSLTVTIDTSALAPVFTAITDDTGRSATDQVTRDQNLLFSGTSEPGATIAVSRAGSQVGTTVANGSGVWSFDFTATTLAAGTHDFTATQTDVAGNTSPASGVFQVTIDRTAPATPGAPNLVDASDTGVSNTDNITNDTTPTFDGVVEPNATVDVFIDGVLVATTVANIGSGAWTATVATPQAQGPRAVRVQATDLAGNVSAFSNVLSIVIDTTPPPAPSTPDLTTASDTGRSSVDNITNDPTPTVVGTAEAGSSVEVFVNGLFRGAALADAAGAWSFTITPALTPDANYSITAQARDLANNVGPFSAALTITIDTAAPGAPQTPDLTAASDTGSSSTDDITGNNRPTFSGLDGSVEADAIVELFSGATSLGTATASATGAWTLSSAVTLADGLHAITATATDTAGNTSTASVPDLVVRIDTIMPAAPINLNLADASDSGRSSTDDVTNVTMPTIDGPAGSAEPLSTVRVFADGVAVGSTTASATGAWSVAVNTALTNGVRAIRAAAEDAAGNVSALSAVLNITIDTAAPAAPSAPDLVAASDSGNSSSDNVTNDTTPTLSGTAEANAIVHVFVDSTEVGTALATGAGAWTFTTGALAGGSRTISARAEDVAGNLSGASANLTVVIDTLAPTAPSQPVLDPASDSGFANDGITNDSTPTLTGTAELGAMVRLFVDGILAGTVQAVAGTWTVTIATPLTDGLHAFTATATDAAGNTGSASTPLDLTIDTAPPSQPDQPDLADASDTGRSSTDNITNDTTPTLGGAAPVGTFVEVLADGNLIGTVVVDAFGQWTLTPTIALAAGQRTIVARALDAAGNVSANSVALTITIDTTAPAVPTAPDLNALSDTGLLNDDDVTRDATPTFDGTAENGATVELFIDGLSVGTTLAGLGGSWTFTAPIGLADGGHNVTARAIDAAGNASPQTTGLAIIVDTVAPSAPTQLDLDAASDSGSSDTDNRTNDTTPSFSGAALAGSTVEIFANAITLGTTTATGGGVWTFQTAAALGEGPQSITATATDAAGNTSVLSVPLAIVIDTTPPGQPGTPDLADGSDSGASNSDNITNDSTPSFAGDAEAGSTVRVFRATAGGPVEVARTTANSPWSVTLASVLADGLYSITVTATDVAGNESVPSNPLAVTIDTTNPAAPSTPGLDPLSDTGSSNSDRVTKDTTPTLTGTSEANATVQLFRMDATGNVSLGSTVASDTGAWSFTPAGNQPTGSVKFIAQATDLAGNVGGLSSALTVTIDTTPPATPPSAATLAGANPGGITNDITPQFTGTASDGATVEISSDRDGVICRATIGAGGVWTCTPSTPLSDGVHNIRVSSSDVAGNLSTASPAVQVTIDSTPPTVIALDPPIGGVTGGGTLTEITVFFSEAVSPATATNAANYKLVGADGGTVAVTPVFSDANPMVVRLCRNAGCDLPFAPDTYTLTVMGATSVTDRAGNKLGGGNDFTARFTHSASPDQPRPIDTLIRARGDKRVTTSLLIAFSQEMNAAQAATAGNYEVKSAGKDKILGTADDKLEPLTPIYFPADGVQPAHAVLNFAPGFKNGRAVQLTIKAFETADGDLLDGDADGTPGGDAVRIITRGASIQGTDADGDSFVLKLKRGFLTLVQSVARNLLNLHVGDTQGTPSELTAQLGGGKKKQPVTRGNGEVTIESMTVDPGRFFRNGSSKAQGLARPAFEVGPLTRKQIDELVDASLNTLQDDLFL